MPEPVPKQPTEATHPEQFDGGWVGDGYQQKGAPPAYHDGSLEAGPPPGWTCKCGHKVSDHRRLSGCGECDCTRNHGSLTIEAGKSFDEGKKGPWIKFDSYEQARKVLQYLPVRAHPLVLAFRKRVVDELKAKSDSEGGKLGA
jgi:hypothetical protein